MLAAAAAKVAAQVGTSPAREAATRAIASPQTPKALGAGGPGADMLFWW